MSEIFERVANSVAVNKTAKLVTQSGFHYQSNKKVQNVQSDTPLKTKNYIGKTGDLTGIRRGRLTVIGMSAQFGGRWVTRCDCGVYCLRRAKSIKNKNNSQDRCEECRHLAFLKRNEHYRRTGKNVDIKEF